MSFESCIVDAVQRNEITQDDADEILARFQDFLNAGMARPRAREKTAEAFTIAGAIKRRQQMMTLQAKDAIDKHLTGFRDPKGNRDAIAAAYGLYEDFGYAGTPNARFYARATAARAYSMMADALEHFRRTAITGGRKNNAQMGDLQRALFGEGGTPEMQKLAADLLQSADWLCRLHNDLGGNTIPARKNWGGPQSYDPFAVHIFGGNRKSAEGAKMAFVRFMDPKLDWARMTDPLTGQLYGAEVPSQLERTRILRAVWTNIVTGGDFNPMMRRRAAQSVANSRVDHRFLVYKNADAKMEVMKEIGTGDVLTNFIRYVETMARDIGLMRVFGPNPSAMNEYIKQVIEMEGRNLADGDPSLLEGYNHLKVLTDAVPKAKKTLDGYLRQFLGEDEQHSTLALAGTVLRNWNMSALIGSAAIPHAVTNPFIQMFARRLGGIPIVRQIPEMLSSFRHASHAEVLAAGLEFSQLGFDIGQGARQLDGLRRLARMSRWWPDRTTAWSGLEVYMRAMTNSTARGMAGELARQQATPWDGLPEAIRRKMEGYGISESDWRVMRMADLYEPDVGASQWLRPKEVAAVGADSPADVLEIYGHEDLFDDEGVPYSSSEDGRAEAMRLSEDAALKMLAYIAGEVEVAVPRYAMRSRAAMVGGTSPGSFAGFTARSFAMFHGFQGSFFLTQLLAMQHMWSRSRSRTMAYATGILLSLWMLGTAAYCIKQMRAGKDIPPLDPLTGEGLHTWTMGFLLGGALPWAGEIIASQVTSWGQNLGESLLGPVVGTGVNTIEAAMHILGAALGPARSRNKPLSSMVMNEAFSLASRETPVLSNLWYGSAAYNRMVLDQLHQAMDPWAHAEMRQRERKLWKTRGQRLWWHYGEPLPERSPGLSDAPVQ